MRIARVALAGDPVHALRPHRDAAFFAGRALEQRQIEIAAFELAPEIGALIGADIEPQGGMRARKRRQQLRQPVGGEVLRHPEPHRAFAARPGQHVAGFFRQRQQPPRIGQQPLAGLGRRHVLATAVQQRLADIVFQPLDLLADGGLGAVDAFAGAGEAAGIDHGHETAQQLQVEHGSPIRFFTGCEFNI